MPNENPCENKGDEPRIVKTFVDRGFMTPSDPLGKILDLADDAVISVDNEERILLFNQSAERIFGYTPLELVGRSLDILLPSRPVALHRKCAEEAASLGPLPHRRVERIEITACRKDGGGFTAEASIFVVGVKGGGQFPIDPRPGPQTLPDDEQTHPTFGREERPRQ